MFVITLARHASASYYELVNVNSPVIEYINSIFYVPIVTSIMTLVFYSLGLRRIGSVCMFGVYVWNLDVMILGLGIAF